MPDREKVIDTLEEIKTQTAGIGLDSAVIAHQFIDKIIALLKEQEAVEPVLIREGRNKYYNDYVCPGCDNELHYGQNYCSECGRAVKWE